MTTIALFNNKGGVGKTTLVYHLASMIAERGESVLAVDLDPQANLSSMFLSDETLEALLTGDEGRRTLFGALRPIMRGLGDVLTPHVEMPGPALGWWSATWSCRRSKTSSPTPGPVATTATSLRSAS